MTRKKLISIKYTQKIEHDKLTLNRLNSTMNELSNQINEINLKESEIEKIKPEVSKIANLRKSEG